MKMTRLLWEQMIHLWAINSAQLDHAVGTAVKIEFVTAPFTPGLNTALGDVPAATTLGDNAFPVVDADPVETTDRTTNERIVEWVPENSPLIVRGAGGGYVGEIHGTRLVNFDSSSLKATERLDSPLVFTGVASEGAEFPRIQFRFPETMVE